MMLRLPLLKKQPSEQLSVGHGVFMGCRNLPHGHAISVETPAAKQDSRANRFSTSKFLAALLTRSQGLALLGCWHLAGAESLPAQGLHPPNIPVDPFEIFQR